MSSCGSSSDGTVFNVYDRQNIAYTEHELANAPTVFFKLPGVTIPGASRGANIVRSKSRL